MNRKTKKTYGITPEIAQEHLEEWLEAELEITTHQSYRLGNQTLTMADLAEVRKEIEYWRQMAEKLAVQERTGGRNRFYHVVPRDY